MVKTTPASPLLPSSPVPSLLEIRSSSPSSSSEEEDVASSYKSNLLSSPTSSFYSDDKSTSTTNISSSPLRSIVGNCLGLLCLSTAAFTVILLSSVHIQESGQHHEYNAATVASPDGKDIYRLDNTSNTSGSNQEVQWWTLLKKHHYRSRYHDELLNHYYRTKEMLDNNDVTSILTSYYDDSWSEEWDDHQDYDYDTSKNNNNVTTNYEEQQTTTEDSYSYWISDEDLPPDILTDLQSTNEDIQYEAWVRRQLDPMLWETFTYWEIYHYFACNKVLSTQRPWWSEEQYMSVRDFYHEFAENDDTPFIGYITRSTYQASDEVYNMSEKAIPYQTGTVKGRGLKAARNIQHGETIFKATNNTIVFNTAHTFRKFLFELNNQFKDPGMICDVLIWAWVEDVEGEIPIAVVVDLDNGNLLNDWNDWDDWNLGEEEYKGDKGQEEEFKENLDEEEYFDKSLNVRSHKNPTTRALDCFASRDIMKGEELLGPYADFVSDYDYQDIGL